MPTYRKDVIEAFLHSNAAQISNRKFIRETCVFATDAGLSLYEEETAIMSEVHTFIASLLPAEEKTDG